MMRWTLIISSTAIILGSGTVAVENITISDRLKLIGRENVSPSIFLSEHDEMALTYVNETLLLGNKINKCASKQKFLAEEKVALHLFAALLGIGPDTVSLRNVEVEGSFNVLQSIKGPHGVQDWILWNLDTFEPGTSSSKEWDPPGQTSSCGLNSDVFFGGHCKFGAGRNATRFYSNLPKHSRIRVTARVHFFDKWDGESLYAVVNDQVRWTYSYSWCDSIFSNECTKKGVDSCGRNFPDRLSIPLRIEFIHSNDSLSVLFSSTLPRDKNACEAAWGIDDVAVWIV